MKAADVQRALAAFASPAKAHDLQWFFKTGPGEYGEGDQFIGITVPQSRKVAAQFLALPLEELEKLASSKIHEHRHCALIILNTKFQKTNDEKLRKQYFDTWMKLLRAGHINNWDLVDVSAPFMGTWLIDRPDSLEFLKKLAKSKKLWERRASIIFTFAFIRAGQFDETLEIAELLVDDKHDLIHKAVGWMLREAGNRNIEVLRAFLKVHASTMPRTMLRYSIEKMGETERKRWLAMKATLG
jgi:3-methyladenine DNA glycosylase AlkD